MYAKPSMFLLAADGRPKTAETSNQGEALKAARPRLDCLFPQFLPRKILPCSAEGFAKASRKSSTISAPRLPSFLRREATESSSRLVD
jgi:hypothetical protein